MERLRVSVVRYLNTAPLVWGFQHGSRRDQVELSFTVPAACAEALRTGATDVGIIPSITYQSIPNLKVIPGIALAAQGPVESVLLVSRVPVTQVRSVALDAGSRASAALVRILFARLWNTQPQFRPQEPDFEAMLTRSDAALVIGDPALQFSLNSVDVPGVTKLGRLFVYDLGTEWQRLTGQPFVFAFWAVQADKANAEVGRLFAASKEEGLAHLEQIATAAAEQLNLPAAGLTHYLRQNMHYTLDDNARAGLESFFRYAHELGMIPPPRALEFIPS